MKISFKKKLQLLLNDQDWDYTLTQVHASKYEILIFYKSSHIPVLPVWMSHLSVLRSPLV